MDCNLIKYTGNKKEMIVKPGENRPRQKEHRRQSWELGLRSPDFGMGVMESP